MAKAKSPYLSEVRGSVAKKFTFRKLKPYNTQLIQSIPVPRYTRTAKQDRQRTRFSKCVEMWNSMSEEEKEKYRALAEQLNLTPYQAFMSQCLAPLFGYNVYIDNTQNPNDLTDFQVLLKIDNDKQFFEDCNYNMNAISFMTEDLKNPIPYYIEEWNPDTHSARIWLKVPLIKASSITTVKLLIDISKTTTESDPEGVFDFFDDFIEDTGRWILIGANSAKSYEIANSILHLPRLSSNVSGLDEAVYAATGDLTQVTVETKMKIAKSVRMGTTGLFFFKSIDTEGHALIFGATGNGRFGISDWNFDTSGTTELYGFAPEYTDYHIWTVKKNGNSYTLIYDGEEKTTITRSSTPLNYLGFGVPYNDNELWVDWIRVRKYADPEPQVTYERAM